MDGFLGSFLAILILLVFSALFSASETAITAIGRAKLITLKEQNRSYQSVFNWLLEDRQEALTTILIGNNLVNIASSSIATTLAMAFFKTHGVLMATVVMTVLIVIFGEILPKSMAMVKSEGTLFLTIHLIRTIKILLSPFVWIIRLAVTALGKLFGVDLSLQSTFVTREEIEQVVTIGEASGALEEAERKMIHGIISFEDTRVSEVMVPRIDMDVLDGSITIEELQRDRKSVV